MGVYSPALLTGSFWYRGVTGTDKKKKQSVGVTEVTYIARPPLPLLSRSTGGGDQVDGRFLYLRGSPWTPPPPRTEERERMDLYS